MKNTLFLFIILIFSGPLFSQEQPNVLIILSDDLTYHDLGCYGNKEVKTPNVDQLAREGLRFEYCFNSAPMCAPTRMSLYTGIHPVRNGGHPNHSRVYDHIKSLPHHLSAEGYKVAICGKRHEAPLQNFPFEDLGGRHHDGGKGIDLDLPKIDSFINNTKDMPWCLVVSSNQPHKPWNRGDASRYSPEKLSLPPYLIDTKATREGLAKYYAEITYFDDQLGSTLEFLEKSGQANQTVVIYLSEQGGQFPHGKWTCYDTGLRSAGIVRYPGLTKPNTHTKAMIQYVDVVPTILDIIGKDPQDYDFDGSSFLEVLKGKTKRHREYSFGIQTSKGIYSGPEAFGIRTIRSDRYRLIWNVNHENEFSNLVVAGKGPKDIFTSWKEEAAKGNALAATEVKRYIQRPEWEFYDLKKDPYEMSNLINHPKYQKRIEEMKVGLKSWMKQQGDDGASTEYNALERKASK